MGKENLPLIIEDRQDEDEVTNEVQIEAARARNTSEIQSMLVVAAKKPRDESSSEVRIVNSCRRYSLAEAAIYAYPRGKEKISGPSIQLAKELARCWGNIKYGFNEIEQSQGRSVVTAYCHDLETNTYVDRTFVVHHKIGLKGGGEKILKDERDIYEKIANNAQRRVRACILQVIPGDIVERAVDLCKKTLQVGEKAEPLIDRIRRMVVAFSDLGVPKEMIEKKLNHPIDNTTVAEIADLIQIHNSIRDGMSKTHDWFDFKTEPDGGKAEVVTKKFTE